MRLKKILKFLKTCCLVKIYSSVNVLKSMASNIELKYIANNQGGMDLLFDGYIMPLIRSNKDCSKNYKCRQHSTNNFNERVPCSASITILNDLIIRGVLEHNHLLKQNI